MQTIEFLLNKYSIDMYYPYYFFIFFLFSKSAYYTYYTTVKALGPNGFSVVGCKKFCLLQPTTLTTPHTTARTPYLGNGSSRTFLGLPLMRFCSGRIPTFSKALPICSTE